MIVNQELDLGGRAENGRNLGRAIPQTHLFFSKISQYRSPDTCLPAMYRQARGLHIPIYQTRQQDGGQAQGAGSRPPASPSCRLYEPEAIGAYAPVGIIDREFVFRQCIGPGRRSGLYVPQPKVTYRDLWEWIDHPFDVLPLVPESVQIPLSLSGLGQHMKIKTT